MKRTGFLLFVEILLLVVYLGGLNAQELTPDPVFIRAKLVSLSDGEPIIYANVFVKSKKSGTISNNLGMFYIKVDYTDTISISMLGFHNNRLTLNPNINYADTIIEVKMIPRVYELQNVDILALNKQKQFEYDVIHLDLPKDHDYENAVRNFPFKSKNISVRNDIPVAPLPAASPISALYNVFSKEGKEQKRLKNYRLEDKIDSLILKKIDIRLIDEMTLMSREKINIFLKWCDFDLSFIENISEYELANLIRKKLLEYEKRAD